MALFDNPCAAAPTLSPLTSMSTCAMPLRASGPTSPCRSGAAGFQGFGGKGL